MAQSVPDGLSKKKPLRKTKVSWFLTGQMGHTVLSKVTAFLLSTYSSLNKLQFIALNRQVLEYRIILIYYESLSYPIEM